MSNLRAIDVEILPETTNVSLSALLVAETSVGTRTIAAQTLYDALYASFIVSAQPTTPPPTTPAGTTPPPTTPGPTTPAPTTPPPTTPPPTTFTPPSVDIEFSGTPIDTWNGYVFGAGTQGNVNSGGTNITEIGIQSRSGGTNPPTGSWVTFSFVNPSAPSFFFSTPYSPTAGVGFYQLRGYIIVDGATTYYSNPSSVIQVFNANVSTSISGPGSSSVNTPVSLTVTSNASGGVFPLTDNGIEYLSPGASVWGNVADLGGSGVFSFNQTYNGFSPNQVGTWQFRSYSTSVVQTDINQYVRSSPISVIVT